MPSVVINIISRRASEDVVVSSLLIAFYRSQRVCRTVDSWCTLAGMHQCYWYGENGECEENEKKTERSH